MRKCFLLETVNAPIPQSAFAVGRSGYAIAIDLPSAFHDGYIDFYRQIPVRGNPLLDENLQLLVDDDDFFRFHSPGPGADKDVRQAKSHLLGRIFGRAFLSQHMGYSWFAHIDNLISAPKEGWSIRPAHPGATPDWLVAGQDKVAVAEAKGTKGAVTANSRPTSWFTQVRNLVVERFGYSYRLKTWIVATRWVTTGQPRIRSKIYAEDPPLDGYRELSLDELPSLTRWIAAVHTANNLQRLGLRGLALRLLTGNEQLPRTRVTLWRSLLPALSGRVFLGLPRFHLSDKESLLLWALICCWAHCSNARVPWGIRECSWWPELLWSEVAPFFDGLDLRVVESLLQGDIPKPDLGGVDEVNEKLPVGVSLLKDGSVIMPLEFIKPVETVEL